VSKRLGVRPALGIRAKLTTQHKGHWGGTSGAGAALGLAGLVHGKQSACRSDHDRAGRSNAAPALCPILTCPSGCPPPGDKAKFGLRAREVVSVVNTLAEEEMLDCLQLLHFHSGSQVGLEPDSHHRHAKAAAQRCVLHPCMHAIPLELQPP
jgi:arginine decarboxylase